MRRPAGAACSGCARPRDSRGRESYGSALEINDTAPVALVGAHELDALRQIHGRYGRMRASPCRDVPIRYHTSISIHGRPVCKVRHEDVGEAEAIGLLNVPVARQRQDSRCPAAVTAVVPESGPTTFARVLGGRRSPRRFLPRSSAGGRPVPCGCSRATGRASSPAAECQVNLTLPPVAGHRWAVAGMALSMRTAAMAAAVGKDSR